jgi:hypothetical protein
MIVKAHTSIIGDTGYNCHSRNFFTSLNKLNQVQVRNWTVGSTWKGLVNDEPHNNEYYMTSELKTMLTHQTLGTPNGHTDFTIYSDHSNLGKPDVHIILNDNTHPYFFQEYEGLKIAYNVWETTLQPQAFFVQLQKFDQVWVPSEWQRGCTIAQGIPANKVKVVPEGVDAEIYRPLSRDEVFPKGRPFRFLVVGRWEYRKSTKDIIKAFIDSFSDDENVELILNVDNPFANDGLNTTEERLNRFGLKHARIKVVHHLSKADYIEMVRTADVFVSCARAEGWNLPLIEAMASGVPSIYSDWGAQLQFAKGKGIPIINNGEVLAAVTNNESWNPTTPGKFADPNFDDLRAKLRDVYSNFESYKRLAVLDSDQIRKEFTWENSSQIAQDHILELLTQKPIEYSSDFVWVTCGNLEYMKVIEKLAISLAQFSTRKILVYGIDCDFEFNLPNVEFHRLEIARHSDNDCWYWKQHACLEALASSKFKNYVWLDGDVIANHNIDEVTQYFPLLEDYPISDVHVQQDFIGFFTETNGSLGKQLFNEELCKRERVNRLATKGHSCMFIFNHACDWFFTKIITVYKSTPLQDYQKLLQWNDEGIDNFLRCKYGFTKFLPLSNFDVSEWDGDLLGKTGKAMEHFITYWRDRGPLNFSKIYGWQFVPSDKSKILYFHGNKNLEFADFMIDYVKMQRDKSFHDSEYFFVGKNEVKNLGSIKEVHGGTLDIANKYGWDYAIYHEIYNLEDYSQHGVRIRKGDVVVDLGGNIGIFTRYSYHMGASKIITFEPDKRYFEILKQNAPANSVLFNAAIGDTLGKLTLTESNHLGGSNLWHRTDPTVNQYEVNCYTLDHILEAGLVNRIDFLKVDIEGSEIIALNGISDDNLSKIRNIVVEYHHEHLKFNETLRNEFVIRLNRLGFNSHLQFCGINDALQLIYFWK